MMETISVQATRRESEYERSSLEADVARCRQIATLLDSQFEFMGFRFGMDAIIGLVPVVGDAVGFIAGLYPIHIARKHKLGRALEWRMMFNLAADHLIGIVPLAGDFFDAMYKANLKNLDLLERAIARRK